MKKTSEEVKDGFLEGLINGWLAKRLWDTKTANAEKTTNYILGELLAGMLNPLAYYCAGIDYVDHHVKYGQKKKLKDYFPSEKFGGKFVMLIGFVGIGTGLLFLSPIITGNVTGISSIKHTDSIIGIALFIAGLLGMFFYLKGKK